MISSDKIIKEFKRIQALGFIKSKRSNNTGIGKTFEDYLGVTENNTKDPDFEDFEVKSQRALASSYITLFTKSPTYPKGANRLLRDTFGKSDEHFPELKVLHTSIFGDRFNNFNNQYSFKITVNEPKGTMILEVKDLQKNDMVANEIYWSFEAIQGKKLKNTFVVWADSKIEGEDEYFHFTKAHIYYDFSFPKMIEGLKNGSIMFDIRIGSYKTGKMRGKPHDHGSGFRVKRENLKDLFEHFIEVD